MHPASSQTDIDFVTSLHAKAAASTFPFSLTSSSFCGWAARNHNKAARAAAGPTVSTRRRRPRPTSHWPSLTNCRRRSGRTGWTDGRMTSLPIYLLRGERGARRNLICRTRLAYHVRDIHSTPKPIRRQALSFPICNELVQRFSPIKGEWSAGLCQIAKDMRVRQHNLCKNEYMSHKMSYPLSVLRHDAEEWWSSQTRNSREVIFESVFATSK